MKMRQLGLDLVHPWSPPKSTVTTAQKANRDARLWREGREENAQISVCMYWSISQEPAWNCKSLLVPGRCSFTAKSINVDYLYCTSHTLPMCVEIRPMHLNRNKLSRNSVTNNLNQLRETVADRPGKMWNTKNGCRPFLRNELTCFFESVYTDLLGIALAMPKK